MSTRIRIAILVPGIVLGLLVVAQASVVRAAPPDDEKVFKTLFGLSLNLEDVLPPPKLITDSEPSQASTGNTQSGGGAGARQTTPPPAPKRVNDNAVNCNADNRFPSEGTYVHTGYYHNTGNPICKYRPRTPGWGHEVCSSTTPTWQDAGYGLDDIDFTGHYTSSGQPICSNEDGLHSSNQYTQEQQLKQLCLREPTHALCSN